MAPIIKIVLAMVIWGSVGIFVRLINLPSEEIVFMRAFISGLVLLFIRLTVYKEKISYGLKSILILIASGLALGLNWIFLFKAYRYTSIANATVSYYMAPVFAVLLAKLFLNEALSPNKIFSMLIASTGMILIVSQSKAVVLEDGNLTLGVVYALSAAVFYAVVMLVNRAIKDVLSFDKTLIQIVSASLMLLPVILIRSKLEIRSFETVLLLMVIAIVHTALPYFLYFDNIKKISIAKSAVLSYVDPLSAMLFGYLIFNETLGVIHIIGGGLILLSLILSLEKTQVDN